MSTSQIFKRREEKTGFLPFPQVSLPVVSRLDASQISSMRMESPHNTGSHFCQTSQREEKPPRDYSNYQMTIHLFGRICITMPGTICS